MLAGGQPPCTKKQNKQHTAPRPRASMAGNQRNPETTGAQTKGKKKGGGQGKVSAKAQGTRGRKPEEEGDNRGAHREQGKKEEGKQRNSSGTTPAWRVPSKAERKSGQRKGEAHQNAPGRPPRPTRSRRTSTRTHTRDPGVASSNPQVEVSASIRRSPGAPAESPVERRTVQETDVSVTGTTHANHRSARSPRRTPQGPARDNFIAGPRTGTTRSEPSAPASAGASGRQNEPGSRPPSACPAQPRSKAGRASPRAGKRHHSVGKANRRTESDRNGRGAAHDAGRRGRHRGTPPAAPSNTDRCQATTAAGCRKCGERAQHATNHSTRSGAKQHQLPSGQTSARPAANSAPAGYGTAAVCMDECAPGGYPAPAGYETTAVRMDECAPRGTQPLPAMNSRRPDARVSGPQRRPALATHSATHRASTPLNRSQVAQDTAHPAQHTEQAQR